ncbi:MAG: hypothetical protein ACRDGP_01860 [Actinomycetota bacterium]
MADEVENQVRFRDFNEWIKASNDRLATDRVVEEFVCGCLDQVLEQSERFATIEKLPGPGMRRAFAMDPRR